MTHSFKSHMTVVLLCAAAIFLTMTAFALAKGKPVTLNWGKETNAHACEAKGKPDVNVMHAVENDVDSGFGGFWAKDTYTRHIQAWKTGDNTYCAAVRYMGEFEAFEGANSPGQDGMGDDTLTGDESGAFQGGYRGTITGTLDPSLPTRGYIGSFDYGCEQDRASCTDVFDWVGAYFTNDSSFAFDWWGWIYHGGRSGTWVNASIGSEGDVD